MRKYLFLALVAIPFHAHAATVWCKLTANVVTEGCVANQPIDPSWTEMDSSDARVTAWNTTSPHALNSQIQQAFDAGFVLTSTGTPALNGTYPITALFMQAMQQEELCLLATPNEFCNLQTTRSIPDITGNFHTFNKTQFNNFLLAVGLWLDSAVVDGILTSNNVSITKPTAAATIP